MKTDTKGMTIEDTILPLSMILGIAELFSCKCEGETRTLSNRACDGIFLTLSGAVKEIQGLIDSETKQFMELERKCNPGRQTRLERTLKDFIAYLEDPDDKPDMKTMAANLRQVMDGDGLCIPGVQ
ncbi:MAG: hypothetical protein KKF12_12310 [Proteobacteria bacterium]|nr:hypothetical protein [Desulfobacula sp.]MBU3951028.1 hypothetical protein [Pseudomonadota bacterium]MBU4131596.1 hypothetical protein [Pseudomonadota bacterium]